jgi:hypothetical protein
MRVDGQLCVELIANLTRIVANLRECNLVDGHVAMNHRTRSSGRYALY